jgi:DNA-binding CsgD family transcriptional regulator
VNLSANQIRVLELMIDHGKTQTEAAAIMGISRNTIHNHLTRARDKLGAASVAQAMVLFDRTRRTPQCPETSG